MVCATSLHFVKECDDEEMNEEESWYLECYTRVHVVHNESDFKHESVKIIKQIPVENNTETKKFYIEEGEQQEQGLC